MEEVQRRRHFACAIAREDHVDRLEPCASSAGVLVEAKDGGRQLFESHDVVVTLRVADAARGTRRKRKPVAHPFARPLAQDLALPLDRHFHALLEQLVEHPRRVVHVHEHVGRLVEQLFQLASGLRSPSSSGARGGRTWECGRGELANAARGGSAGWRAHRLRFVLFCSGTYIAVAARWAVALVVLVHAQRRHILPARSLAMGVRDTAAALEIGALRLCYAVPNPTGRVPVLLFAVPVLLSASYPVPQGVRLVVEVSPVAQRQHVLPLVVGWPPPARLGMLRAPAGGSALARGGYRRLRQKVDGGRSGKGAGGGGCKCTSPRHFYQPAGGVPARLAALAR